MGWEVQWVNRAEKKGCMMKLMRMSSGKWNVDKERLSVFGDKRKKIESILMMPVIILSLYVIMCI